MEIHNRVVFVTGGAHGIGRALCHAVHLAGGKVAVADIDLEGAEAVAREVNGLAIGLDVSDEKAINEAITRVENHMGLVDIFVSNAGVAFGDGPDGAASAPNEHWQACIDINLMAHVYAARAMVPRMVQRGSGCLVNVVSAAGLLCQVGEAAYTATKHAAAGFAQSLAITHGDDGIHVCLVCPQAVATRMIGMDDDSEIVAESTGVGGNDVDGILSSEYVADCILAAIEQEKFLVLPHPQVETYMQRKAEDMDRWIGGMRRFRRQAKGETE